MVRAALILALLVPLAGCGWIRDTFSFGGGDAPTLFRGSVKAGEDRRDLAVTVAVPPGATLDDFRESARFPVTRYCIETYGTSEAEWATDPTTGDWAVARTTDAALLQARCTGRA
jgi:hypothetical protein